jgi:hypothetical protein
VVDRQRAIADTSVFVGLEATRIDDQAIRNLDLGVSTITLGELRLGVLSVRDNPQAASRRLATFQLASRFEPLPVDERVSDAWAELVATLRADGRRAPVNDTWIAATAITHGLPVLTQDTDYDIMPGLTVIKI